MTLQLENSDVNVIDAGRRPGRFRVSVRMLIGMIACCGAGLWVSRPFWDPVLIAVGELRDPNSSKRVNAVRKLTRIGMGRYESVIPPLTLALVDVEPQVRVAAVAALASLCSDSVTDGPADKVAADAVSALIGSRTHPSAASPISLPVLVEALAGPNSNVRLHLARALRPLASNRRTAAAIPALLAILRKSLASIERQGHRDPDTRLAHPDPVDETNRLAIWLLSQVGPDTESAGEIVAALVEAVRSEPPNLRQEAAYALGRFRSAAEPALLELLNQRH
jgi:HEAT repeat protein